jgi:hypothetical protein
MVQACYLASYSTILLPRSRRMSVRHLGAERMFLFPG